MPQRILKVTDPKTNQVHRVKWYGDSDPTDNDLNDILSQASTQPSANESNIAAATGKSHGKVIDAAWNFGKDLITPSKPTDKPSFTTRADAVFDTKNKNPWAVGPTIDTNEPLWKSVPKAMLRGVDEYTGGFGEHAFNTAKQGYQDIKDVYNAKAPLSAKEFMLKRAGTKGLVNLLGGNYGNLEQDILDKNIGAVAGDIIPPIAMGFAAHGINKLTRGVNPELLPKTPAVDVVPPVKQPLALPGRPEPFGLLNAAPEKPGIIAHPTGRLAQALDPNAPEALRGLDLQRPGTTLSDYDRRMGQYTDIGSATDRPANLPGGITGPIPESYSLPRSQGIQAISPGNIKNSQLPTGTTSSGAPLADLRLGPVTDPITGKVVSETPNVAPKGEVSGRPDRPRVLVVRSVVEGIDEKGNRTAKTITTEVPVNPGEDIASAIKHKKISGEIVSGDWLDSDPLYSHVPNRLRPEAPNVKLQRSLSEGQQQRPGEKLQFASGERPPDANWGGEPTTVSLTGEKGGPVRNQRLNYLPEDLPNRVEELSQPVLDEFAQNKAEQGQLPSALPKGPIERLRTKTEPIATERVSVGGQGGRSIREILKDQALTERAAAAAEKAKAEGKGGKIGRRSRLAEAAGLNEVDTSVVGDMPESNMPPVSNITAEAAGKKSRNLGDKMREAKAQSLESPVQGEIGSGIRDKIDYMKFMKGNPTFKAIMDRLIKHRSASNLIGKQVRKDFGDIANIPKEKVIEFQEALKQGNYPKVREFFENHHKELTDMGIEMGHKKNYLPQMWEETPEKVRAVFGDKELNSKASFQFNSFFEDYQKGVNAGLTPKYSPIELMQQYAERANKLKADNIAIAQLKHFGYIVDAKNRTANMQALDPNIVTFGKYYAHPSVKTVVEGYLKSSESQAPITNIFSRAVGKWSNLMLSSGVVPNKPMFTAHGFNIANPLQGRSWMEGGKKRNVNAVKYGFDPESAAKLLDDENLDIIKATQEDGYSSGVGDTATQGPKFFEDESGNFAKSFGKKAVNKFTQVQHKYFEKPLLEKMLPAIKWESYKDNKAEFIKQGMSEKEAGRLAVQVSDDFYGGANLDLLYRNKSFNSFARAALLAPDWLRSTLRLGEQTTKATNFRSNMSKQERLKYLAAPTRWLATYAAVNLIHKAMNGKFMTENDDPFSFDLGHDASGKKRSVKVFGGAADFLKLPLQEATQAGKGGALERRMNFFENRFSPLVQTGLSAVTGGNYKDETNIFRTRDQYGREVPATKRMANTLSQIVNMGPPQISSPINYLTGRMSGEEALARIAELPLSYKNEKKAERKENIHIPNLNMRKSLFQP